MYKTGLYSKRTEYTGLPESYSKAKGIKILSNGKWYKDFTTMGIGCNLLGYNNKKVNNAVKLMINNGVNSSLAHKTEKQFAEVLTTIFKYHGIKFFKTGGEACLNALNLAKCYTKTDNFLLCGYSGHHIENMNPEKFKYNDLEDLKLKYNYQKIIIIEAVRNYKPDVKFWAYINYLQKQGVIIILDEITSGFRFKFGESIRHLIKPDIVIFGKSIANGYPLSFIMYNEKIKKIEDDVFISSTQFTDMIGIAASIQTLALLSKCNYEHLNKIGHSYRLVLSELAKKHGLRVKINQVNQLLKFEFENDIDYIYMSYFIQEMQKEGYLVGKSFYPSFCHTFKDIVKIAFSINRVFSKIKYYQNNGVNILHLLKNTPIIDVDFKKKALT